MKRELVVEMIGSLYWGGSGQAKQVIDLFDDESPEDIIEKARRVVRFPPDLAEVEDWTARIYHYSFESKYESGVITTITTEKWEMVHPWENKDSQDEFDNMRGGDHDYRR